MAIEMTLEECAIAEAALARLSALVWPIRTAYHMSKLLRLMRAELRVAEQERLALVKELGCERPTNEMERNSGMGHRIIEVPSEKMDEFQDRRQAIVNQTLRLDWAPLTLDEFGEQKVSAIDIADLGPVFSER
jgi:hypothetical protein